MKKLVSSFVIIVLSTGIFAQNPGSTGSIGLLHTHTSEVLQPGYLDFHANMNFYTKLGDFLGDPIAKPANFQAANYWLVASNLTASVGIIDHLDASLSLRLYQDTHYSNVYNLPDDLFLTIKTGSHFFARRRFAAAFLTGFRFATGEKHNYPFAEYASGAFEYGFFGAISYYTDPYLRDRAFSLHYNLGWWNHNEAGTTLYTLRNGDELKATVNSSNIQMNLGAVLPVGLFDVRFELTGILFTQEPDPFVYSAEEWAFFSPSIRYKPYDWISMDLGLDIRISPKDRQNTMGIPDISSNLDLPKNYPPWKVQMGLNFSILPFVKGKDARAAAEKEEFQQRVDLYRVIQDEEQKAKNIEEELENLRREREAAEKEIEELKKMLEEGEG